MNEGSGCVVALVAASLVFAGWIEVSVYQSGVRERASRRAVCLERGGYYVAPGLRLGEESMFCIRRPVPVDITPKGARP